MAKKKRERVQERVGTQEKESIGTSKIATAQRDECKGAERHMVLQMAKKTAAGKTDAQEEVCGAEEQNGNKECKTE